jgi:hypothetical protein
LDSTITLQCFVFKEIIENILASVGFWKPLVHAVELDLRNFVSDLVKVFFFFLQIELQHLLYLLFLPTWIQNSELLVLFLAIWDLNLGLMLARQVLCHLSHMFTQNLSHNLSPFWFNYFLNRVLYFCLNHDFPNQAPPHNNLISWGGVSLTFFFNNPVK